MKNKLIAVALLVLCAVSLLSSCKSRPPVGNPGESTSGGTIGEALDNPNNSYFYSWEEFTAYVQSKDKEEYYEISEEAYLPVDRILEGHEIENASMLGVNRYFISCKGTDEIFSGLFMYVTYNPEFREKSAYELNPFPEYTHLSEKPFDNFNIEIAKSLSNGYYECFHNSYEIVFGIYEGELGECQFKIGDYYFRISGYNSFPYDETASELVQALRDSRLTVELIKQIELIIAEQGGTIG